MRWRGPLQLLLSACFDRPARDEWLAEGSGRPIVLLHGFGGRPCMLRPFARHLCDALGRPVLTLSLGFGLDDLRDIAECVHETLEEELDGAAPELDVVGHSLGGLVGLYLFKYLDRGRRIRRIVTLATPHRGVPLARGVGLVSRIYRVSLHQMESGSTFLERLARMQAPPGSAIISVAGRRDWLVPPAAARIADGRNLVLEEANHWSFLLSRRTFGVVGQLLDWDWHRPRYRDAAPDHLQPVPRSGSPALARS